VMGDGRAHGCPDTGTPAPIRQPTVAPRFFKLRWSLLRTLGICAALGPTAALAGAPGI
jgi:chromate transporter